MAHSPAKANQQIRAQDLVGFACVFLQLLPWFYVSAQSSPIQGQSPPPVWANPPPGPLDSWSEISCRQAESRKRIIITGTEKSRRRGEQINRS